jgi:hypothetical protein
MDIDKHIVVKEIGILTYPEVIPVYKHRGYLHLDIHGHSGYDIVFNPPVEVQWKYSEISLLAETVTVKKVEFEYDFGMKCEFSIDHELAEHPDYWKYRGINAQSPVIEVVKRYVEEQLMFALHRNPCELDYVHWALRGWLRNRATLPWHNQLVKL